MRPSDISPGGQVYDRTTGTWVGENTRSVGEDISSPGRGTFVIHDANGPVGVHLAPRAGSSPAGPGPGSAAASTGGSAGGGDGPGGAGVPGVGAGPGSGGVLTTVWWEKVGKGGASAVPGSLVLTSALPPLQPVMKGTNTALQLGGKPFMPQPGTSNAQEIEDLMGDGDNPLEAAWWMKQYANTWHISHNLSLWANDPATKQWAKEFDDGVVRTLTGSP